MENRNKRFLHQNALWVISSRIDSCITKLISTKVIPHKPPMKYTVYYKNDTTFELDSVEKESTDKDIRFGINASESGLWVYMFNDDNEREYNLHYDFDDVAHIIDDVF